MIKLYTGIDLHSNNNYIGIRGGSDRRVYKKGDKEFSLSP
jgi:hypothetical protein